MYISERERNATMEAIAAIACLFNWPGMFMRCWKTRVLLPASHEGNLEHIVHYIINKYKSYSITSRWCVDNIRQRGENKLWNEKKRKVCFSLPLCCGTQHFCNIVTHRHAIQSLIPPTWIFWTLPSLAPHFQRGSWLIHPYFIIFRYRPSNVLS